MQSALRCIETCWPYVIQIKKKRRSPLRDHQTWEQLGKQTEAVSITLSSSTNRPTSAHMYLPELHDPAPWILSRKVNPFNLFSRTLKHLQGNSVVLLECFLNSVHVCSWRIPCICKVYNVHCLSWGEHTHLWSQDLLETQITISIPDSFTVTETRLQTLRGNRPPKFWHAD